MQSQMNFKNTMLAEIKYQWILLCDLFKKSFITNSRSAELGPKADQWLLRAGWGEGHWHKGLEENF